ncbi:MAG: efflux RND transporter periplasmic adaptor subunit [Acidobacteriota bacterium]
MKRYCNLLLITVAMASLTACGKKDQAQAANASARPAAPVVVAVAEQRDVPVQLSAIGNVESYQTVQIRSQVNGQIQSIFFKEGQDVHKGQLLFQLDKKPFQADLEKAQGMLQHDEAQAANSRLQAERYNVLEMQGVASKEQADQVRAQAKADASAVYADRAAVDAAKVQLQYTDIKAPIDARTGALLMNVGNLVKANDTPFLVQLNQVTPIYATFSIPENQLDAVRKFAAGNLKVLAFPKGQNSNPAEGKLTFIDNGVDMQTGTVKLKATFANKDRRLWPGQYVDVVLNLSTRKQAVLVPTKAIQTGQQGQYVYVVTPQSTAESRNVETSGTYQNSTVIAGGVSAGEKVVVDGQLRVAPNAKVLVQSTVPTTPPGGSENATAKPVAGGGL